MLFLYQKYHSGAGIYNEFHQRIINTNYKLWSKIICPTLILPEYYTIDIVNNWLKVKFMNMICN